jgi:hypothetical protein
MFFGGSLSIQNIPQKHRTKNLQKQPSQLSRNLLRGTMLLHLTEVTGVSISPRRRNRIPKHPPKMANQESMKTASPTFARSFAPSFANMQSAA